MEGCSKYCTFCVVPYTRGEEVSRPLEDVLTEVADLAAQGVREVTLLGQNVNAYRGLEVGGEAVDFAMLLECVSQIPGIGRIRYTTSHPKEFTPRLIEAHRRLPQLAEHVHLPLQSGSDRVLAAMKRGYTLLEYKSIVRRLRARPGSGRARRADRCVSTAARATRNRSALTFVYDGDNETLAHVTGALDENLRQIENELEITIQRRGHRFRVEGAPEPAQRAVQVLEYLLAHAQKPLTTEEVQLRLVEQRDRASAPEPVAGEGTDAVELHTRRRDLHGRTPRQRDYLQAIISHDISFGIGPAGTGKTYLA